MKIVQFKKKSINSSAVLHETQQPKSDCQTTAPAGSPKKAPLEEPQSLSSTELPMNQKDQLQGIGDYMICLFKKTLNSSIGDLLGEPDKIGDFSSVRTPKDLRAHMENQRRWKTSPKKTYQPANRSSLLTFQNGGPIVRRGMYFKTADDSKPFDAASGNCAVGHEAGLQQGANNSGWGTQSEPTSSGAWGDTGKNLLEVGWQGNSTAFDCGWGVQSEQTETGRYPGDCLLRI